MATEVTCIVDTDSGAGYHYTSLNAAIVGESGGTPAVVTGSNLVLNDEQLTIECRATSGSADTAAANVTGFTVDATRFVKIHATGGQRHSGTWNSGIYRLQNTSGTETLKLSNAHTLVDGLQIYNNVDAHSTNVVHCEANGNSVVNCIVQANRNESFNGRNGVYLGYWASGTINIKNNIIYHARGSVGGSGVSTDGAGTGSLVGVFVNNTVVDCDTAILAGGSATTTAINNIVQDSDVGFSGTFTASSNYNLSDAATAPGANSVTSTSLTFADAANDDYHLASTDTAAIGAGIGPSSDANVPTADIDGDTRSGTTTDIGADLYVAVGGGIKSRVTVNSFRRYVS